MLRSSSAPGQTIHGEPKILAQHIMNIAQSDPYGVELYMFGHSYGAHLILKTAIALAPLVHPRVLMSVDAISPKDCYLPPAIRSIFQNILIGQQSQFLDLSGCTRFPSDFNEHDLQMISKQSRWLNSWQTQMPWLHSAASAAADVNLMLDFNRLTINPHDDQAIDKRILELFTKEWAQSLKANIWYARDP